MQSAQTEKNAALKKNQYQNQEEKPSKNKIKLLCDTRTWFFDVMRMIEIFQK